MTRTAPARRFGEIAGTLYVALGIVGFTLTGVADLTDPVGVRMLGLELNGLHNLIHVLVGAALLLAASHSEDTARITVLVTAAATGAAGLLGLAVAGATTPLALNQADNALHLLTATVATTAWLVDRRAVPEGVRR